MIFSRIRKFLWALLSLSFVGCSMPSTSSPTAEITSIASFSDVDFDTLCDLDTIVMFDVDETLIQPQDAYLVNEHTPQGQLFREALINNHPEIKNWEALQGIMLMEAKRPLIEPDIIQKISQLKKGGITVMAITAMNTGPYGRVDRLEAWRYAHLQSLGITGSFTTHQFSLQGFKRRPVFFKGIIATDLEDKGHVFGAVLDHFALKPRAVILFDDTIDFLLSLQAECLKRGITFRGYHYLGARKKDWDQTLFMKQAQHLITHKHWLDDQTAKQHIYSKHPASLN